MALDATWNGLIVSEARFSMEEVERLAKQGIHRIDPNWKNVFARIREETKVTSGAPYQPTGSMTHTCPCIEFVEGAYNHVGLEIDAMGWFTNPFGLLIKREDVDEGDLVFLSDRRSPHFGGTLIDHIGIITDLGSVIHGIGARRWEGCIDDFLANGHFLFGQRLVGTRGLATFSLPDNGTRGFSPENEQLLRAFLA